MNGPDKIRENRLRRMADRQGLRVVKSPRRDTRAWDYGRYVVTDRYTGAVVAGGTPTGYTLSIDDVETYLTRTTGE